MNTKGVILPELQIVIASYLNKNQEAVSFCLFNRCHQNENETEETYFIAFYFFGIVYNHTTRKKQQLYRDVLKRVCETGNTIAVATFLHRVSLPFFDLSFIVSHATKKRHVDLVRFLIQRAIQQSRFVQERPIYLYFLARYNHVELFQYIFDFQPEPFSGQHIVDYPSDINAYFRAAVKGGSVSILKFLLFVKHFDTPYKSYLYILAAKCGHCDLLSFFDSIWTLPNTKRKEKLDGTLDRPPSLVFTENFTTSHLESYEEAASNGKVNVLLYLEEKFPFLKTAGFRITCSVRHIKVYEHFKCHRQSFLRKIFWRSLLGSDFSQVEWIQERYSLDLKKRQMSKSLTTFVSQLTFLVNEKFIDYLVTHFSNLLEESTLVFIFQKLLENEIVTTGLFLLKRFPFLKKHVDIQNTNRAIRYYLISKEGFAIDYRKEIEDAAEDGNLERVQFLYETQDVHPFFTAKKEESGKEMIYKVAQKGFLSILRFFFDILMAPNSIKVSAFFGAVKGDQMNTLVYVWNELKDLLKESDIEKAILLAIRIGSVSIVRFLHERVRTWDTKKGILLAATWNRVDILEYLDEQKLISIEECVDKIFESNFVDTIEFVLKRATPSRQAICDLLPEADLETAFFLWERREQLGQEMCAQDFGRFCSIKSLDRRELYLRIQQTYNTGNTIKK